MANNWKITDGVNYIAKTGAGGAAGTMEAPKLLASGAFVAGKNVIGAGSYIWPAGYSLPANCYLYADGYVKILGDTSTSPQLFCNTTGVLVFDVYFEQWAGIALGLTNSYTRCIFDLLSYTSTNFGLASAQTFANCVFLSCGATLTGGGQPITINNSLFINSCMVGPSYGSSMAVNNSYFDSTSGFALSNGNFTSCNVDPLTAIGTNRGLKVGAGAWGNGQSQTGCVTCITQAPQFNNPAKGDYTLKFTSPHIALGIGPAQYSRAASYAFVSTAGVGGDITTANTYIAATINGSTYNVPIISITGAGFTLNGSGALVIKAVAGGGVSTLVTGALPLNPDGRSQLTSIGFIGATNFDSDFVLADPTVPRPQNTNVPDYNGGTAGGADRKPNRFSQRIRWSDLASPDVANNIHWTTAGTFVEMELFTVPTYNLTTSLGNGSTSFVAANALPVLCRNWQLEFTMRDNYGA